MHEWVVIIDLKMSSSFSYNPLEDDGLKDMKPGLLKCQNLKILG